MSLSHFASRGPAAVTKDGIAMLNKSAFEKIFRDVETMQDRVPVWAAHVEAALPLDDASAASSRCVARMRA